MSDSPLAKVLVCEQRGWWASLLRARAKSPQLPLVEVPLIADLLPAMQSAPASVVAIEVTTANAEKVMRTLVQVSHDFPLVRGLALCTRGAESWYWYLRAAGACHVQCGPRNLETSLRIIRLHLHHAPRPERSLREEIYQKLPWNRHGTLRS